MMDPVEKAFVGKLMATVLTNSNLHYVKNEYMSKDEFMKIQQDALKEVEKEFEKAGVKMEAEEK